MNFKSKPIISVSIVIAVIVVGAGFWYWSQRNAIAPETTLLPFDELSPAEAEDTLGGQIIGKAQNPFKGEIPELNPFRTETNPLKNIYLNPF